MSERINSSIKSLGLPRLIIIGFFLLLCVLAVIMKLDLADLLTNILIRIGMNGILVLAMVPAIQCGIGLNFGASIGIVGGIIGGLVAIEYNMSGFPAFAVALLVGFVISWIAGVGYGMLLNQVKGSEMTVSTYVGFSVIAFMNIMWLVLPFKSPYSAFAIGGGLRNTISMESSHGGLLMNLLAIEIKGGQGAFNAMVQLSPPKLLMEVPFWAGTFKIPTGALLFFALLCVLMSMFLNSKKGIAMSAVGNNPRFAVASGINVDKMRILGTAVSTAASSAGIIMYAQCFGFIQLYNAPLMMSFASVAAVLIGGASVSRAKVSHAIIGVFLFQAIISMGLPVANKILPEGNLSEVMRLIISNGIILYALSKAKGGSK